MTLSGKTIVVTGAASGIGHQVCRELRRLDAEVIGVDRVKTTGVDHFFDCDLIEPGAIDDLVAALPRGADGLCNVAGVPPTRPGPEVLAVNFLALRRLTLGLVPKLSDRASVVNLASMAGNGWRDNIDEVRRFLAIEFESVDEFARSHDLVSGPRSYFLSKEAVIVWTMQNRWTWRDRGIRMNCVSPGPVETPILPDFLEVLGERAQESVRNMERFGAPSDVVPAVVFLLSDESAWFRGANLTPDGGMGAHLALKRYELA